MAQDDMPYAKWSEPASKGDLIRVVTALDTSLLSLSLAVAQTKAGKSEEVDRILTEILKRSNQLGEVLDELGGRSADGE